MDLNNSSEGTWRDWAKFIVSEIKRFGDAIVKIEDQIKCITETSNELRTDCIKLTLSENHDVIHRDISDLRTRVSSIETSIKNLETFKAKITTIMAIINIVLGIAVTIILGVFKV